MGEKIELSCQKTGAMHVHSLDSISSMMWRPPYEFQEDKFAEFLKTDIAPLCIVFCDFASCEIFVERSTAKSVLKIFYSHMEDRTFKADNEEGE